MDKALNTLGIANKARMLIIGDNLTTKIKLGKVILVILAKDSGLANYKKIQDKCKFYKVECLTCFSKEEFFKTLGKHVAAIGFSDKNIALKFKANLKASGLYEEKYEEQT